VYLTEDEGLQVIREELARHGVQPTERDRSLPPVIITGTAFQRTYEWVTDESRAGVVQVSGPLEADLVDRRRSIAIEFVTHEDYFPLGGRETEYGSHDLRGLAAEVAGEVGAQGRSVHFGAFYDPVTYRDNHFFDRAEIPERFIQAARNARTPEEVEQLNLQIQGYFEGVEQSEEDQAKLESKRLLRQQVRDFIDWLKAQGVI
jgi:hypothetical protein